MLFPHLLKMVVLISLREPFPPAKKFRGMRGGAGGGEKEALFKGALPLSPANASRAT